MECARDQCTNLVTGDYRAKYCSQSCAAQVNNWKHPKRLPACIVKCFYCGDCFKAAASHRRKYCSRSCSTRARRDAYLERINCWEMDGSSLSSADGTLPGPVRTHLIKQAGEQCTQCGWCKKNPVTGSVILTVNHIDGNWKNNTRSNLEVLCFNCHTLTPTFGALNVGSISGRRPWAGR